MGKKKSSKHVHQKKKKLTLTRLSTLNHGDDALRSARIRRRNFWSEAGPGCHIARKNDSNDDDNDSDDWVLEWEDVDPRDYYGCGAEDSNSICDLAVDPEAHTLTLCNIENVWKVAYITIYDCVLRGRNGKILASGWTSNIATATAVTTTTTGDLDTVLSTTDSKEKVKKKQPSLQSSCTTLIVLCPPYQFVHLCYLPEDTTPCALKLESDVQEWQRHPNPGDTHSVAIGFPLATTATATLKDTAKNSSFLCTQGVGGHLTHFFGGNEHAIDFRCPVGTAVRAVGPGRVVAVSIDNGGVTGIGVQNLFHWNSILLELDVGPMTRITRDDLLDPEHETLCGDGPLFVEYVHIASACVSVGDTVVTGQVIGQSGSVGFSPEPHLHLACYRSGEDTAVTCRVYFRSEDEDADNATGCSHNNNTKRHFYMPEAGREYNQFGPIEGTSTL